MSNKKFVDLENLSRFWGDSDNGLKKYIDDRDAAVLTIATSAISSHASKVTSKTESGHVKIGDNISVSTSGVISLTQENVIDALGYTPPTTNTTYNVATSSVVGLVPAIGTVAASTIKTQKTEWVLASTSGDTPTWRKLPSNAFSNTTYSAGSGLSLSGTVFSLKTGYIDNGKNYKVQLDSSGNPFVNVPWTDTDTNTTYSAGSGLSLSGTTFSLKTGYTNNGKNYKVQLDSSGNPFVNVPWTDTNTDTNTTYIAGSGLSLSGTSFSLKTGYTTNGKNYKVQLDSDGNPYVNVPWTDNNTTYSAGSGLSLSGTTFAADGNAIINNLTEGTSQAVRTNYIVAQDTAGGSTYHRRSLANIFTALNKSDITTALGYTPPTTNTTYGLATTGANGLMSSAQVSKLDGIATGANKVTATSQLTNDSGFITGITKAMVTNALGYTPPTTNTTYSTVTSSVAGLAPKIGTAAASTIGTQSTEWVLASTNGDTPTWRKLPSNAFSNTTYSAGSGLSLSGTTFSLKTGYTTTGKNYKVQLDSSGNPFVNVPWTDTNTTYSLATTGANGLMSSAHVSQLSAYSGGLSFPAWDGADTVGRFANNLYFRSKTQSMYAYVGSYDTSVLMLHTGNISSYANKVTATSQLTNDSGFITGITKTMVTNALGYTPPTTNTTYSTVTSSVAGLAPKIGTAAASTIGTQSTEWVLASTNGGTPSWRKLPANAFNNTTYSFSNKAATLSWGTTTTIATVGGTNITITMPANPNTNTTYSAGSGLSLSGTTFSADGDEIINNLSEGTSPAQRTDRIVAQYAGGGTTTTTYHRRSLANIFAALNKSDITTALGYTPPTTNTTYSLATTTSNGLMSSAQVSKLNSLSTAVATSTANGLMSATQCSMVIPNAWSGADTIGRTANTLYLNTKSSLLVTTASNTYYVLHSGNYNQYIDQVLDSQKWNGYTISVSSSIPTNASSTQITFVI